jgi:hypothetical protein
MRVGLSRLSPALESMPHYWMNGTADHKELTVHFGALYVILQAAVNTNTLGRGWILTAIRLTPQE